MAVQSLAADTKLHMLFDETRHKGENVMDYKASSLQSTLEADMDMSISEEEDMNSEQNKADLYCNTKVKGNEGRNAMENDDQAWEDEKDCSTEYKYIEEEDNKINMEAYNTKDLKNGLQKSEQAGVLHLIHRWTQRGHPDEVCATGYIGLPFLSL